MNDLTHKHVQQEFRFFPSFPGWPSSNRTASSGWQRERAAVVAPPTAPRAGRKTTASPASRKHAALQGGPCSHSLSLYWTESDHMASPEPLTTRECKPNKPIPEAKVRLHRGGWPLSKTEALFGRRWMLPRHRRASSTAFQPEQDADQR